MSYTYIVTVEAASLAQADEVMANRIGVDENYGFDYTIDHKYTPDAAALDEYRAAFDAELSA